MRVVRKVSCINYMKMEVVYSSETLVSTYNSTQRHFQRRENLKSHTAPKNLVTGRGVATVVKLQPVEFHWF
jgi:hypothetical protein